MIYQYVDSTVIYGGVLLSRVNTRIQAIGIYSADDQRQQSRVEP